MENLRINAIGIDFYKRTRKDTLQSVFIAFPICLLVITVCFTMIVGVSLKLLYILIWPVILIGLIFLYVPLFYRRRYANYLIRSVKISDNIISIESFEWFLNKPIFFEEDLQNAEIIEAKDEVFFKGKDVVMIKFKQPNSKKFYLIPDFFDKALIDNLDFILKSK